MYIVGFFIGLALCMALSLGLLKMYDDLKDYERVYHNYEKEYTVLEKKYENLVKKYCKEPNSKKVSWAFVTICGTDLELSGTKLQKELFEKKCKEEEEEPPYSRWHSLEEIRRLAMKYGISVKITK